MNIQTRRWALTLTILAIGTTTLGQTGGQYDLSRSIIDGGGATSTGGAYVLSGTIAQPDAGWMAGGDYELLGGFWPDGPACIVNFEGLARFAEYWLEIGTGLPTDLHEDNVVNLLDFGVFVNEWLGYCPRGWPSLAN